MGNVCCVDKPNKTQINVLDVHQEHSNPNAGLISDRADHLPPQDPLYGYQQEQQYEPPPVQEERAVQSGGPGWVEEDQSGPAPEPAREPVTEPATELATEPVAAPVIEEPEQADESTPRPSLQGKGARKGVSIQLPDLEETFEVVIEKPDLETRLGMDLSHRETHLVIRKLYEGYLVAKTNEEAKMDGKQWLQEGDVIVAVNSVQGNDQEMLRVCREAMTLTFNVFRA